MLSLLSVAQGVALCRLLR